MLAKEVHSTGVIRSPSTLDGKARLAFCAAHLNARV